MSSPRFNMFDDSSDSDEEDNPFRNHAQPHSDSSDEEPPELQRRPTQLQRRPTQLGVSPTISRNRRGRGRRRHVPIPIDGPVMDRFGQIFENYNSWKTSSLVGRVMEGEERSNEGMINEYNLLRPLGEVTGNYGNEPGIDEQLEEHNRFYERRLRELGLSGGSNKKSSRSSARKSSRRSTRKSSRRSTRKSSRRSTRRSARKSSRRSTRRSARRSKRKSNRRSTRRSNRRKNKR